MIRRAAAPTARALGALLAVLGLVAAGCGSAASSDTGSGSPASEVEAEPTLEGTLTVAAATSLRGALTDIGDAFTAAHPGVEVTFAFGGSSTLATQIVEGAPADVFASADEATMARVTDEGLTAGSPEVFARNGLAIVAEPGNPAGITSLADLADAGIVSLCGAEVPCGRYAQQALDAAGVSIPESRVTRGQNVGATLAAVAEGDAVAGIVYLTDAQGAGGAVEVVPIPAELDVVAAYPIAVLTAAADRELAEAFVALVLGDAGQAILRRHGFRPPR